MLNFWVWKLSKDPTKIVSYCPNGASVLCFARVTCEDIRREFGVQTSNEVLCELANGRTINRELLREIANRLFESGQGKAIPEGLVVDISRSDLSARKKEFAWGEYDLPESMGIPVPTKTRFSKFEEELDIVDRMLRSLGHGRFSLSDPNAGQKSESGADVLAKFDDRRIGFQVAQYHSDVDGNTGTRGSSLRREESRKAAAGLLAPAFIKPISMPALVHLVQEKAKKGWSQKEFPDMRLLIAASIPQLGGTGATFLSEGLLKVDELEALLSPILEGTKYSAAYLYVMMLGSVYEWTKQSRWKKLC